MGDCRYNKKQNTPTTNSYTDTHLVNIIFFECVQCVFMPPEAMFIFHVCFFFLLLKRKKKLLKKRGRLIVYTDVFLFLFLQKAFFFFFFFFFFFRQRNLFGSSFGFVCFVAKKKGGIFFSFLLPFAMANQPPFFVFFCFFVFFFVLSRATSLSTG